MNRQAEECDLEIMLSSGASPSVEARDLVVRLGSFTLGPLSLSIPPSEIVCFLGPNGAGKTTLLRALTGLTPRVDGKISVLDCDPATRSKSMLRYIGIIADDPSDLIEELTARELWQLHAIIYSRIEGSCDEMLDRADQLAEAFHFVPPDAPIATYSYGMKKKTQIIAALLQTPTLIVADEPRNGLDPFGIKTLESLLSDEAERGATVIVASHDIYWAERLSDRVGVLIRGKLLAYDPPQAICLHSESLAQAFFRLAESP
jgi:ABC-2 type transport system ATP-binding protein